MYIGNNLDVTHTKAPTHNMQTRSRQPGAAHVCSTIPSLTTPRMRPMFLLLVLHLTLSRPEPTDHSMDPTERRALASIMASLLPDPSWSLLHPRPCTDTPWPGLQCEPLPSLDPFLHVTHLHISPPCHPSATLPSSLLLLLPHLTSLSVLSCLTSTSTPSILPSSFFPTNGSSLRHLLLFSNPALVGPIPSSISHLAPTLRVLRLSQNSLHGPIPRDLPRLPHLQHLDLSYNRLSGCVPPNLGDLSSLVVLDLSHNRLSGTLPASVGSLGSLQKMDLSYNSLTGVIPPEIGKSSALVLLDLSRNNMTGPVPGTLRKLNGTLEYLIVEGNPMNATIPGFFGELGKLSVLGMSRCGLVGGIPEGVGMLRGLTALELDGNRLSGPVPEGLERLPRLGVLNLSGNMLSGEVGFGEEFVRRLGRRLDLRGNVGLCASGLLVGVYEVAPPCGGGGAPPAGNNGTGAAAVGDGGREAVRGRVVVGAALVGVLLAMGVVGG